MRFTVLVFAVAALGILFFWGCTKSAPQAGPEKPSLKAQTVCPVMGNPIDKKVFIDYQGKRIYFCCPKCIQAFKKDPQKYLTALAKQGVKLEEAPKD